MVDRIEDYIKAVVRYGGHDPYVLTRSTIEEMVANAVEWEEDVSRILKASHNGLDRNSK